MNSRLNKLIDKLNVKYPEGLSRGLDNEIKYELYYIAIPELFNARRARISSLTIDLYHVDHYAVFLDDEYVYIYSQPYGSGGVEILGWEQVYYRATSWYFPKTEDYHIYCSTSLYRAPITDFAIYLDKDDNIPIVLPAHLRGLTPAEMRFKNIRSM